MASVREYSPTRHDNWYGYHVRMNSFEQTKAKFENTKPIQGKRMEHGWVTRPLSKRSRTYEIWHHDESDGSYGMAFSSGYFQTKHNAQTNRDEIVGIANKEIRPLLMWHPDGRLVFTPNWMYSYSTWEMLAALLPYGITFVKYGSKQYFKLDMPDNKASMYMHAPEGVPLTFVPYERDGKRYFHLQTPYPEQKLLVDKDKAKAARDELKEFFKYADVMWDLMTPTEGQSFKTRSDLSWDEHRSAEEMLDNGGEWLFRKDGEEIGERWADVIAAMIVMNTRKTYTINRNIPNRNSVSISQDFNMHILFPKVQDFRESLRGEKLYRMAKTFNAVDVPLGEPFFPTGRTL